MRHEVRIEKMSLPPTHPGEMLLEEFLKPLGMTQVELAEAIRVPIQRINEIINQKRGVTPETALKLDKYFGISASFWLGLQKNHDLWSAYQKEKSSLDSIIPRSAASSGINNLLDWIDGLIDNLWEPSGTFSEAALVLVRSLHDGEVTYEDIERLYAREQQNSQVETTPVPSRDMGDSLAYLVQSTSDESIRKDAIDLLQVVDSNHPLFDAVREKDLSLSLGGEAVALRVMFIPRLDERYSVIAQVYPIGESNFLPEGLRLTILDESGNEKITHITRARDNLMNRPLVLDKGDRFRIKITIRESEITEEFVI